MTDPIPFTPMKIVFASKEAYELFDDGQWNDLMRRRGIDFTKKITYHVTPVGVTIKQWNLPNEI